MKIDDIHIRISIEEGKAIKVLAKQDDVPEHKVAQRALRFYLRARKALKG